MKKLMAFLSSAQLMAVIMGIFFIAIAAATFIENDFGTPVARTLVYNAPWFNAFLFIGIINLLAVIIKNKLYRKEKLTLFAFHVAFVLILTGAGITRFFGYDGIMTIREGQTADWFLLNQDQVVLSAMEDGKWISRSKPVPFSGLRKNRFILQLVNEDKHMKLKLLQYMPNAVESVEPFSGGTGVAELVISGKEGRRKLLLKRGQTVNAGSLRLAFEGTERIDAGVFFFQKEDGLYFRSVTGATHTTMTGQTSEILPAYDLHPLIPLHLYHISGHALVLTQFNPEARIIALHNDEDESGRDAFWVRVSEGEEHTDALIWKSIDGSSGEEMFNMGGTLVRVSVGPQPVKLPFALLLEDFRIERYPGSHSPSWYESQVILHDSSRNIHEQRRIFMNNVLKHKGFRFYQSSYDTDEKGTVLSVNHDLAGTVVTYAGYLLMALGMALSLLNKNSRFRFLAKETRAIGRSKELLLLIITGCLFSIDGPAQPVSERSLTPVNASHAEEFGKMLTQKIDGRIEPLNTLSSQVLRKLYRKDLYKGMNADQVLLGMLIDFDTWQYEPVIRTRHTQIQEILGSKERYFSFSSFFDSSIYVLQPFVEKAFRKKPAYRTKFDNEIIRLDERVNIAYLVFTGDLLRIFPKAGDSTYTWYSPSAVRNNIDTEDSAIVYKIVPYYIEECRKSLISGNWTEPDKVLSAIKSIQLKTGASVIPPAMRVKMELYLNKYNLFDKVSDYYGLIGFLLLLYQFICLFYPRIRKRIPVIMAVSLILILFILHTSGLILRWYVSGHAPWSNGYEALIYIAWATVLAGLIFARQASITISTTAVLAFLILHTAHLSWMDPQITSLVPVLKSYWLVIHVATITASYGFLALGALLAAINLLLMAFSNRGNHKAVGLSIKQLSCIVEMTLIVGLYLLTIGTFLGAVWANESWGRYWGWDPKETWALATVIVYAFIVHIRHVPGLSGPFGFNLASVLGLGSVIMTYFGVNYYLSGLHSYAKGDPLPIPSFVYYTLGIIALVAVAACINQRRLNTEQSGEKR